MIKKIYLYVIISILICSRICVYAEGERTGDFENSTEITAQAEESVENILNEFENNSEKLQEKVDKVIEEKKDNFIVKLFKSIIEAISNFLDAIFGLALEITKIR